MDLALNRTMYFRGASSCRDIDKVISQNLRDVITFLGLSYENTSLCNLRGRYRQGHGLV